MKKFFFTAAFLFIYFFSFAAPVISVVNNGGNWRNASTWDLNRQLQDGDTVVIPVGKMVVVDNNWNISPANLFIKVYGILRVAGGGSKLVIGSESYVWAFTSGLADGTGIPSAIIKIGGNMIFRGNNSAGQFVMNTKVKGISIISLSNGQDISLARQVIL